MLFKRGSKAAVIQEAESEVKGADVEKPSSAAGSGSSQTEVEEAREAAAAAPPMTDTFSWQHLNYTIPLGHGETRKLLDDVSGYVAPGKLTALVGSSGAGKVHFPKYYILASRLKSCIRLRCSTHWRKEWTLVLSPAIAWSMATHFPPIFRPRRE